MSPMLFGLIAGVAFGALDVALMLPMSFPDKRTALIGAIGFLIPFCKLPLPAVVSGATIALLVSLPDAVITKSYVPILATGIVGGAIIGWLAAKFVTW